MEQARIQVWDFVFKHGPSTLARLADDCGHDLNTVAAIVDHDWFTLQGDTVSIATSDTATPS